MLGLFATSELPALSARGASPGTIVEALVFAVPFVAALSIPMAVLTAVLWEFTRLGADGTLAAARRNATASAAWSSPCSVPPLASPRWHSW